MLLFELGTIVTTEAADEAIRAAQQKAADFLQRHVWGDWGEVDDATSRRNALACIINGHRYTNLHIKSIYTTNKGVQFYVVTEGDRSVTRILLASENGHY